MQANVNLGAMPDTDIPAVGETQELLQAVIAAMIEGLVIHAPDGTVISANPAAESLLGLSGDQLLGKNPIDWKWRTIKEDGTDLQGKDHPAMITLRTGHAVRGQVMGIYPPNEARRWISVNSLPVFSPATNEVIAVVATFVDISEIKRQETALLEANSQLTQMMATKDNFFTEMSHELRTPLNAIIGFTQLLYDSAENLSTAKQHEFHGHVLASGQHLLKLVNDHLDVAKIHAGKIDWESQSVDIVAVCNEVISAFRPIIEQSRLTIGINVDQSSPLIDTDASRLRQILFNYLSNALKFSVEGGHIDVSARLLDDQNLLRIEVADSGVGISTEDISRLFRDFEQLDGAAAGNFGAGLGLAVTRRVVESRGGTVGVTSDLGKGSVFFANIPIRVSSYSKKE